MASLIETIRRLSPANKILIALLFALAAFAARYARAAAQPGIDFWRPLAVVRVLDNRAYMNIYSRQGRETIYQLAVLPQFDSRDTSSKERAAALETSGYDVRFLRYQGVDIVHSPLLLAMVRPFGALNYTWAHRLYVLLSLFCFFAGSYLLSRLLSFSTAISALISGSAAIFFKPESGEMAMANVNNLQLLLLVVFLWLQSTNYKWADIAGGVVLALGVALKPNLAMIFPAIGLAWIGARLWAKCRRVAIGGVAGLCIALLTTRLVVPTVKWIDWIEIFPRLMASEQPVKWNNISLTLIASHLFGAASSYAFLLTIGLLLALVTLRPLFRRDCRADDQSIFAGTFLVTSAGILLMLLTPRLVWGHYAVLAVPAILYAARRSIGRRGICGVIGVIVILVFTSPVTFLLKIIGGQLFSLLMWDTALLVLFSWVLVDLWNGDYAAIPRQSEDGRFAVELQE